MSASGAVSTASPPARTTQLEPSTGWITPAAQAVGTQHRLLQSKAAGLPVSYHVYVPKAARDGGKGPYPVLYWLHGTGGGIQGIAPLAGQFEAAIAAGKIPPVIVVFPNGLPKGMWVNSKDGERPIETILIAELIPEIDRLLPTIAAPSGRIIEGFSMGGYGAARIGFKHHRLFGGISILAAGPLDPQFSGPLATAQPALREEILRDAFGGDLDYYRSVSPAVLVSANAAGLRAGPQIQHVIGERDFTLPDNVALNDHMRALGIAVEFIRIPQTGHSTLAVLNGLGERRWAFYRKVFGGG